MKTFLSNIFSKSNSVNGNSSDRIYLDYASLTPVDPVVLEVMQKFSGNSYANPSSFYKEGVLAKKSLAGAHKTAMEFLHSVPEQNTGQVVFTSGGTEANNMAVIGTVEALHAKGVAYDGMHIVVSAIEHSSVRECANFLSERGVDVTVVPVDTNGVVMLEEIKKALRPNTVLVSIMTVNNEIGTVQPIRDIAKIIRQARDKFKESSAFNFQSDVTYPLFHTDAAQGLYEELHVDRLGVDLLTLDGTKVFGPCGVGALYIRRDTPIVSVIKGGGQENGLRSGTENMPGIMGFVKALELVAQNRQVEKERLARIRADFIRDVKTFRTGIVVHGHGSNVSPHIVNVAIPDIESEFFVLKLDAKGVACSTKSSCLRDEDESYVLKAIGARSKNSVRFSFGRFTTEAEIKKALAVIRQALVR